MPARFRFEIATVLGILSLAYVAVQETNKYTPGRTIERPWLGIWRNTVVTARSFENPKYCALYWRDERAQQFNRGFFGVVRCSEITPVFSARTRRTRT